MCLGPISTRSAVSCDLSAMQLLSCQCSLSLTSWIWFPETELQRNCKLKGNSFGFIWVCGLNSWMGKSFSVCTSIMWYFIVTFDPAFILRWWFGTWWRWSDEIKRQKVGCCFVFNIFFIVCECSLSTPPVMFILLLSIHKQGNIIQWSFVFFLFSLCVHNSGPLYISKSEIMYPKISCFGVNINTWYFLMSDFIIGGTDMPTGWLFLTAIIKNTPSDTPFLVTCLNDCLRNNYLFKFAYLSS